jgi:hypothetical protein
VSGRPEIGGNTICRRRIGTLLSAAERKEIRKIQNNVIASLHRPPKTRPFFNVCEEVSILYLKEFESLDQPYGERDDIAVTFHLICRGEIGISRSPDSVLRPAALLLP